MQNRHDDVVRTLVPVNSEEVVCVVSLDGFELSAEAAGERGESHANENYLLVEHPDQRELPIRDRVFDVVGPLSLRGNRVLTLLEGESRFDLGSLMVDGEPTANAPAQCDPLKAPYVIQNPVPRHYEPVLTAVYPLRDTHAVLGGSVGVRLSETGRLSEAIGD